MTMVTNTYSCFLTIALLIEETSSLVVEKVTKTSDNTYVKTMLAIVVYSRLRNLCSIHFLTGKVSGFLSYIVQEKHMILS